MNDVQALFARSADVSGRFDPADRDLPPARPADFWPALFDGLALALMVCDRRGAVRFANCAARHELAAGRVLCQVGQMLQCTRTARPSTQLSFDRALQLVGLKGRRQLLALSDGSDRLMVSMMPLPLDDAVEPLVLLVFGRRGACSQLGLEMLASAHGLTCAERRVLQGLIEDQSPRDIAAAGGVALSTVRTQIASIRTKLGVSSINGLLIRAAEVPPIPSALRSLPAGLGQRVMRSAAPPMLA